MDMSALREARESTDGLFREVLPPARYERPIPERHRLAFYVGHLEAFDWNLLRKCLNLGQGSELDELFAFGIDPPVGEAPADRVEDWPRCPRIQKYVQETRARVDREIGRAPAHVVDMLLEHRWMHRETLAYMLHQLPGCARQAIAAPPAHIEASPFEPEMVAIPAGFAVLGAAAGFRWDNERGEHRVPVDAFRISRYKVTNGQYLNFVEEGGMPPAFWVRRGDAWFYKAFDGEIPLPLDWPVYATKDQAEAYAAATGHRLPTEAEYHRAAYGDSPIPFPWGDGPLRGHRANANFVSRDLQPVTAAPAGESPFGVAQAVGNGWEWTSTPFGPLPGFEADPLYPNYSAPFFDGERFVVKGASPVTAAKLIRPSFRNWFRRDYPYAYVTFRTVED